MCITSGTSNFHYTFIFHRFLCNISASVDALAAKQLEIIEFLRLASLGSSWSFVQWSDLYTNAADLRVRHEEIVKSAKVFFDKVVIDEEILQKTVERGIASESFAISMLANAMHNVWRDTIGLREYSIVWRRLCVCSASLLRYYMCHLLTSRFNRLLHMLQLDMPRVVLVHPID